MAQFSRRVFFQVGGLSLLGLAFKFPEPAADPFYTLGRVTTPYLRVFTSRSETAKQVGWFGLDDVIRIYDSARDPAGRLWHELANGFVETTEVQPVANQLNIPVKAIPAEGFIGEITVPFTEARRQPQPGSLVMYRLYYGSAYWVRDYLPDSETGIGSYKLYDERLGIHYYVPAPHVRQVPESELTPIHPETPNKRIVVNLKQQNLIAYEGPNEIFSTLISAGRIYLTNDGASHSWTPAGQFQVERKKPSRHMGFGEAAGSDYELPGVPWVSYFHWKGFSFHGTWWHNDYGHPRSAGCVNMRPLEAHWIYRWSQPIPLPNQELTTGSGTQVNILED